MQKKAGPEMAQDIQALIHDLDSIVPSSSKTLRDYRTRAEQMEKLLRQAMASAWQAGYDTCYNDGGEQLNPYVTEEERAAEAMARATGSVGATYTVTRRDVDGNVVEESTGTWGDV